MQDARRQTPRQRYARTTLRLLCALALALAGFGEAWAADPCTPATPATTWGQRVAAAACAEHRLWYAPFLDGAGRLASTTVSEAENSKLQDRTTPAWRRVVDYWKATGLLWSMGARPGANECSTAAIDQWPGSAACRAFVIDTPWSAVFVSFAYVRAGVPGFAPSASHVDFVHQALRGDAASPLRYADPDAEAPAVGDLLCFTRGLSAPMGAPAFRAQLQRDGGALAMHCDVVVAADRASGALYTVGGNVLQGVTMRTLRVNRSGALWGLPRKTSTPVDCRPGSDRACTFNRQDWVALLKLEPKAAPPPPAATCCTLCPLPMPAGMTRCPATAPTAPVVPPPTRP